MAAGKSIVAGSVLAAGIIGAGLYGLLGGIRGGSEGEDGGVEPVPEEHVPTEAETCSRIVRTTAGRAVRVVGVSVDPASTVEDTDVGRAVEVTGEALTKDVLCNLVFRARIRPITDPKSGYVTNVPDVPGLEQYYGIASEPVMIGGSCKDGECYWNLLLSGASCKEAGDFAGYVGSEIDEFLKLDDATKARFLRTPGKCGALDCEVAYGDPKAVPGAPVYLPHAWAGRRDLNYPRAVDGKPEARAVAKQVEP